MERADAVEMCHNTGLVFSGNINWGLKGVHATNIKIPKKF